MCYCFDSWPKFCLVLSPTLVLARQTNLAFERYVTLQVSSRIRAVLEIVSIIDSGPVLPPLGDEAKQSVKSLTGSCCFPFSLLCFTALFTGRSLARSYADVVLARRDLMRGPVKLAASCVFGRAGLFSW